MQGPWGWGATDQHCDAATRHWQGQWESHGCGEASGWGAGSWDQLDNGENNQYEEFENVMRWDDLGALDAFETAKKLNEERSKGLRYSVSLPSPDLYIQVIDWNSREDLKLPDPGGTLSPPQGERKMQRKRGRKGSGGFRRQFDRQETSHVADCKQSSKPFSQSAYHPEVKAQPEQEHLNNHGSSSASMMQGSLDPNPRTGPPLEWQLPLQAHSKSNWSPRWSSSYPKQNPESSKWHDHGRSHWDGRKNNHADPSQHRWRPTNVSSEQARGWGHGGAPYWSSHGLSNDSHFQTTPIAHGTDWMPQHETNVQSFPHQSMFHLNAGSRQEHLPSYAPDKTRRWRPRQQSNRTWQ